MGGQRVIWIQLGSGSELINKWLWKKNPACIVIIAGSQSIRAEDTRDLPMFLGTFMVPAVLWNIIGFKMNNCKRVVMTDIVDRVLMNEVNDRTLGLIQEWLEKTFLKKLKYPWTSLTQLLCDGGHWWCSTLMFWLTQPYTCNETKCD